MEIITYCSKNYESLLKKLLPSWKNFCNDIIVYTDSNLEINANQIKISSQQKNWRCNTIKKVEAIQIHAEKVNEFVFLDSDCFVGLEFSEVFKENFTVGVTGEGAVINSGVMFFKNSRQNKSFFEEWASLVKYDNGLHSEQDSLNKIYSTKKFSMKMFPKSKYNAYVGFKTPFCEELDRREWVKLIKSKPKIVHFQGAGHFKRFRNLQKLIDIYNHDAKEFI